MRCRPLLLPPGDVEHADRILEPAQRRGSPIGEQEAFTGGQLADDVRGQDVARLGRVADAAGKLHRRPEEIGIFRDGLARVQVARGDLGAAIESYRDLITVDFSSRYNAFVDPRYVLRLAELLDQNGEAEEAREHYLRFADFWADADPQFQPMVERARARAAETSGSGSAN